MDFVRRMESNKKDAINQAYQTGQFKSGEKVFGAKPKTYKMIGGKKYSKQTRDEFFARKRKLVGDKCSRCGETSKCSSTTLL